jgi:hypothetical protein
VATLRAVDGGEFEGRDYGPEIIERLSAARARMIAWDGARGPREAYRRSEECPARATHDKLEEAHYFLHGILFTIHHPDEFRWNLNAFLQACRSVLYLAKSDLRGRPKFTDWWTSANAKLDQSPVVKRVVESRNFVVHERMLNQSSRVHTGIFRGSKIKLAFTGEPSNDWYSEALLRYETFVWTGVYLEPEHSEYDMQFGVKREWRVAELGDGDVVVKCHEAFEALRGFVTGAHEFAGVVMPVEAAEPEGAHDPEQHNLVVETDLDPTLAEKWWG